MGFVRGGSFRPLNTALVLAVNAVKDHCYGNDREDDETMPPSQDENAEGKSVVLADVDEKGMLAMAGSVPHAAETEALQTEPGGGNIARRESRRVAASKKKATHVQDEPTLR